MRSFFSENEFIIGNNIDIIGEEFHHMTTVLRLRVGDEILLINGTLNQAVCKIISIDKKVACVNVAEIVVNEREPSVKLTLFQAMTKGDKLELVAQKFTELGGYEIIPFSSKFSVGNLNDNKITRLQTIINNAVKQCKRSTFVKIRKDISFNEMLESLNNYDHVLLAYENEDKTTLKSELKNIKKSLKDGSIAIIVGSEGGFDESEVAKLSAKAKVVTLGKTILRAETASISMTANVLYELE